MAWDQSRSYKVSPLDKSYDFLSVPCVYLVPFSSYCCKCRWYRTLLPDSSREIGDVITWPRFYVNYTGCQCDKESGLKQFKTAKQLSWCTSAFTAWLHHTWHHTANQHHPALFGPICDPPSLANSTFLARRLTMGRVVSLSMDQLSGTAYLLNFGHLTSRWVFS